MPDPYYLAVDPGVTIGWATFDQNGSGLTMGQASIPQFYEMLRNCKSQVIIVEDYRKNPEHFMRKEHAWSRLETVRVIGAIEFYCFLTGKQCVEQPNTIKPIAYMWAGMKPSKNHKISHEQDAYVHGVYYLQKAGIRKPQQGAG